MPIPLIMITVIRESPYSGEMNAMDLPITLEQLQRYQNGEDLIQNIFPNLTAEQREFIKSGYTPEDWKAIFG